MGIPYYFYVIARKYPGILDSKLPKTHYLIFDFNALVHPASQDYLASVKKIPKDLEKPILKHVNIFTQKIIDQVQPEKQVQIYIDGVAPLAKMNQQRRRRFLSVFRRELANVPCIWDSNQISPGTPFMKKLHTSLKNYIKKNNAPYTFTLSTSDDPGEGEHKIFKNIPTDGTKVIYGMDADLIMLALMSQVPNIYLFREENVYLNIDALREGILHDLKHHYHFDFDYETPTDPIAIQMIETYITVCFILGNDFLPHPIHVHLKKGGLEELMIITSDIYNRLKIPLIHDDTLNWMFISKLFEALAHQEQDKIFDALTEYHRKRPHHEADLENYPLLNKDPFVHNMLFKIDRTKWRLHYYKHTFGNNDTSTVRHACDLYLKGIEWTYRYYKKQPKDNDWYYPYAYAPSIRDISNHLNSHLTEFDTPKTFPPEKFVSPSVQLLCIMPETSLPEKEKQYMKQYQLDYLFPSTFKIHTFMKNLLWECIPILPPMNHQILTSDPKLSS